jgi:hypothetical protein
MRRLSLLPLICFGIMMAYACYGAAVVGHWPYYAHPDPKELPARVPLTVGAFVMLIGAASLVCLPLGYGIWRIFLCLGKAPAAPHRAWVLWYLAGVSIWLLDFAAGHYWLPWHSTISWILD